MDFFNLKLTDSRVASADLRVISEDGAPLKKAYCINIESSPEEGSFIRHIFWLPLEWNGIFLGIGNGGVGGKLGTDLYVDARDGTALGQTDMGTYRMVSGELTRSTPALIKDYGWRATHLMTVVAKELILAYYGRLPDYSYFQGGSAGGKQALAEAQRYPEDYDGIVARCPSFNSIFLGMHFLWVYRNLRNTDGTTRINDALRARISSAAIKFFGKEGSLALKYGYVETGYKDENTVRDFIDLLKTEVPELTDEQLEALKNIYEGPKNPKTGEQIHCGLPIGAEMCCGYFDEGENIPKYDFPWFRLFFGQDYDERTFDYSDDVDKYFEGNAADFGAVDPDLRPFASRGGKLIMTSGGSDPYGPWADAMNYYNSVCRIFGSVDSVTDFFRYFIIPGKGHGADGLGATHTYSSADGKNEVAALRKWREQGIAPDRMLGVRINIVENGDGTKTEQLVYMEEVSPYDGSKTEGVDYPPCTCSRYIDAQIKLVRESLRPKTGTGNETS